MGLRDVKLPGRIGELVQAVGLVALGIGIATELVRQASSGFILITIGSVVFAIGCKLKG